MSIGNFLEIAEAQNGISVGFGKMFLIYAEKQDVEMTDLTATAINADIADGTIVGIVKGWNTVVGASVAEVNAERNNGEVKLSRQEIIADTLTFDDNVTNNKVMKMLVKHGTLNCVLLDDMGYAFGAKSLAPATIETMRVNFSNKTTNGLQNDQTNEKTVAVTARYLVDEIGFLDADVEVEDIEPKVPIFAKVSSITSQIAATIVFVLDLFNEETGALLTAFTTTSLDVGAIVNGNAVTAAGAFASNQLTVTLTSTVSDFSTSTNKIKLTLSTPEYYMTEIYFDTATFTA
jgi:hypothetical protein